MGLPFEFNFLRHSFNNCLVSFIFFSIDTQTGKEIASQKANESAEELESGIDIGSSSLFRKCIEVLNFEWHKTSGDFFRFL